MKYIENDGQVTREYEVKINTKELESIIEELSTKCYRIVNKETRVAARTKEEATEKVNAMDKKGIRVHGLKDISVKYPKEVMNSGLSIFDCEYLCKQNTHLVYILETILSNYRSTLSFKNQNYLFIDKLIQFEDDNELKSYDLRLNEDIEKLSKCDVNDLTSQNKIKESITATLSEMEYNKDYNFDLLRELYERAKSCFELRLVAETIHYKDLDKNPKVYKIGTKKII